MISVSAIPAGVAESTGPSVSVTLFGSEEANGTGGCR